MPPPTTITMLYAPKPRARSRYTQALARFRLLPDFFRVSLPFSSPSRAVVVVQLQEGEEEGEKEEEPE